MKFLNDDGTFDLEGYRHAARISTIAQEIAVDYASYPTQQIGKTVTTIERSDLATPISNAFDG